MGTLRWDVSTDGILRELSTEDGLDVWELCRVYQEDYRKCYGTFPVLYLPFTVPANTM